VNADGINHTWLTLGHHEIFARFTFNREWDVSEHFVGALLGA
jgi:4,5-dihydroxyphthalate decarboxylase